MSYALECSGVYKMFGRKKALDDFSLNVPYGKIVGLLGPNGAGKTTLMKSIVSLVNPQKGTILIEGHKPSVHTKSLIAYLPDGNFLYQWMTIEQAIHYFQKSFLDFNETKARQMISNLQLDLKQTIGKCSKGMQERVNMSLTLSRNSKVYIFDEPLATVDPLTRDRLVNLIKNDFNKSSSSLLISTHLINDVESLFDDVAIISDGKLLLYGSVNELKQRHNKSIEDLFKEVVSK